MVEVGLLRSPKIIAIITTWSQGQRLRFFTVEWL